MPFETGIPYVLIGEDGTRAAIGPGMEADADFVGYLDGDGGITGFEAPPVRESRDVAVGGSGAVHGTFRRDGYVGTLQGAIVAGLTAAQREAAMTKLGLATDAFAGDGVMRWTPSGQAIERAIWYRSSAASPLRYTGRIPKSFQVGLVSVDWRALSYALVDSGAIAGNPPADIVVTNSGNVDAPVYFVITGPVTNPVITHLATGRKISLLAAIAGGATRTVYAYPPTVPALVLTNAGANADGEVDPANTDWSITPRPGANTFRLTGAGMSGATALRVLHRHAWRS